jgi:hypothetical protein
MRPGISVEIPINLEKVLLRASADPVFKEALLEDPGRALAGAGFSLTGSERAVLSAMDRPTLETTIDRFASGRRRRGRFARHVAAAVAGSMIITASCITASDGNDPGPPGDTRTDDDVVESDDVQGDEEEEGDG